MLKVEESGSVVISGAYVDLHKVSGPPSIANHVSAQALLSDEVFHAIKLRVDANLDKVKKINGVFLYIITQKGKTVASWTVDLKKGELYKGEPTQGTKADCTLTVDDADMVDLASGKLNPQVAFMKGKLKIKGNIMLTQKMGALMKEESKL